MVNSLNPRLMRAHSKFIKGDSKDYLHYCQNLFNLGCSNGNIGLEGGLSLRDGCWDANIISVVPYEKNMNDILVGEKLP